MAGQCSHMYSGAKRVGREAVVLAAERWAGRGEDVPYNYNILTYTMTARAY